MRATPPGRRAVRPSEFCKRGKESDESWSLIQELEENRNAYRKPPKGEESHLKLSLPYQEQIKRLCKRVSPGPFGKDPGMQPACFACIAHGLERIEEWGETQALIRSSERRKALPDDTDKDIAAEISRYAEGLKLPPAPASTAQVNVSLDSETGSRLVTLAKAMDIPHHSLAVLCILVALSGQPSGVIQGTQKEIRAHLEKKIKRQLHTAAWCADALMDKLEAEQEQARKKNGGRR